LRIALWRKLIRYEREWRLKMECSKSRKLAAGV